MTFEVVPLEPGALAGAFAEAMGFELMEVPLAMVDPADVRQRLDQRIRAKDRRPANNYLLITAGAPLPDGSRYPLEEWMLLNAAGEEAPWYQPPPTVNLRWIALHCWETGLFARTSRSPPAARQAR
jgi:hypothetical protein